MRRRTDWQKYGSYFVMFSVFICLLFSLVLYKSHLKRKEFIDKLIFLKKPPADAAHGGHWAADGSWNNEPYVEKPKLTIHHNTKTEVQHDALSDKKLTEVQRLKHIELLRKLADLEAMIEYQNTQKPEIERAMEEQREFLELIQKYNMPILVYEDYDFIFSYPTPVEILEKYHNKESLQAFCVRVKKYQSMLLEVAGEIDKRPAFAKSMRRDYPDLMNKIEKLIEMELPLVYTDR